MTCLSQQQPGHSGKAEAMSQSVKNSLERLAEAEGGAWFGNLAADSWLTRPEASAALRAKGFDISAATLASLVTRGGGPPYRLFMGVAKCRWRDLLEWAEARSVYRGGKTVATWPGTR
jgi:hypothetical protein